MKADTQYQVRWSADGEWSHMTGGEIIRVIGLGDPNRRHRHEDPEVCVLKTNTYNSNTFAPGLWRHTPKWYRHDPLRYQTVILQDGTIHHVWYIHEEPSDYDDDNNPTCHLLWVENGNLKDPKVVYSWVAYVDAVGHDNIKEIITHDQS